jgi:UDP-N-acetylglucosamine/UDP-N-acetylgalactosamine diphosphorylase
LINFCDGLIAGGTSRQNHSEVGSSYIHFNFTPDADKTTPSLIGDVPRGVMLNQSPIFLGGQGGIVGPVRLGYGNVVAAGSILRRDYPQDDQLIFAPAPAGSVRDFTPAAYPNMRRVLENNILYLANLKALEAWYRQVRKAFFEASEFGPLLYAGVMEQLALARKERLKRLGAMAQKAAAPVSTERKPASIRTAFYEQLTSIESVFSGNDLNDETKRSRDVFLEEFQKAAGNDRIRYIETIQHLPPEVAAKGVAWLKSLVDDCCERVATAAPSLNLFNKSI